MNEKPPASRLAVGVMTGTSIDGIDAALVRIEGRGLAIRAELIRHSSNSLGNIGTRLRAAAEQQPMTAGEFARLAWEFGEFHAEVIGQLVSDSEPPDMICIHGQTVFHQPPLSWQLANPAPIAQRFQCPIVSDLRQADLAAGGQGAPITPIADWILLRDETKCRAIINLGGFCNVTILPAFSEASHSVPASGSSELDQIRGFDVCACNQILDEIARGAMGKSFDEGGAVARSGRAKPQAATALLDILTRQRTGKRSLGTGDEALQWMQTEFRAGLSAADLAASAVDGIASCISAALGEHAVDEIILAGGGARNLALVDSLKEKSQLALRTTADLGVPIEARESMCFAVLGALCADDVPITLPQVTGGASPAPVSGSWTGATIRPLSRESRAACV